MERSEHWGAKQEAREEFGSHASPWAELQPVGRSY